MRIRDLVHGYVHLNEVEASVVDHPLFQRLRHVRQNDVAFYVYPCVNISRFEHSLGVCHVAGKMAANLATSALWPEYQAYSGLSPSDFQQLCRLYALLHDVGHLPLSHLFEHAFVDFAQQCYGQSLPYQEVISRWFGGKGFAKPHEACGSSILETLIGEIPLLTPYGDNLRQLMGHKRLPETDPLRPIKLLIDSELDADRADSTARDGMLSGGEYGNFNLDRFCSSVFLRRHGNSTWGLAYSHTAISSIEALLADRCHTHTWVHFHHRVISGKAAARLLIGDLLANEVITPEDFGPQSLADRDDIWLWSMIRSRDWQGAHRMCADAITRRAKAGVKVLWKHRAEYQQLHRQLRDKADLREDSRILNKLNHDYEITLSEELGVTARVWVMKFDPVGEQKVHLTDETGSADIGELLERSAAVRSLNVVWSCEPQYHVVLVGANEADMPAYREKWVSTTASWLSVGGRVPVG